MSDLGSYPPPPAPPAPPEAPAKRRGVTALVLVVAIALVAGGAFGVYKLATDDDSGPTYPKHWDSRILPYVKIAEKERGLNFEHPVAVRFLDPKKFEKGVRAADSDLSEKDKKQLKEFTGELRALGLINGDVDLFKAINDAQGSGTLAYYSFETQSVTVRGTKITPSMKSTLVHELTHALQDQRFDVGRRSKKLNKKDDDGSSTDTAASVFKALIEGDARRVETKYRESLSATARHALDESAQQESDNARKGMKDVPDVVLALMDAPYTLGESMLSAADQADGNAGVDKLFIDPPAHDKALLDPFTLLSGDDTYVKVPVPKTPSGGKKYESGEFGALDLYLVLAARLPLKDALAAADGWGGDGYIGYNQGGTTCVAIDVQGETAEDTTALLTALQQWNAADPHPTTTVAQDDKVVHFVSCDPGTDAKPGKDASQKALELAAVRTYVGTSIMKAGVSTRRAGCVSAKLAQAFTVAQLVDPKFGQGDPKELARAQQIGASCA